MLQFLLWELMAKSLDLWIAPDLVSVELTFNRPRLSCSPFRTRCPSRVPSCSVPGTQSVLVAALMSPSLPSSRAPLISPPSTRVEPLSTSSLASSRPLIIPLSGTTSQDTAMEPETLPSHRSQRNHSPQPATAGTAGTYAARGRSLPPWHHGCDCRALLNMTT